MIIEQNKWSQQKGWEPKLSANLKDKAQLVFVFGSTAIIKNRQQFDAIRSMYPKAKLVGCSTAGEICGTRVLDDSLIMTAVHFEKTRVEGFSAKVESPLESFATGQQLARQVNKEGLSHVFVLSDGLNVNGSELVRGLADELPSSVAVTGGLSGDGANFKETYVVWDQSSERNTVVALGFYGGNLRVGYGSLGGWDSFGPERMITKSKSNILYELDNQSALELYKKYLGEHAEGLPATGLLFPLSLRVSNEENRVVRTILAVNENEKSMTFAGDMPEGTMVRLMKANFDRLIDGAVGAAQKTRQGLSNAKPQLAILISCVGRKLILKQRIEEEVEGVRDVLGESVMTGFYSYGEISPFTPNAKCELHNQTMTITTFTES